MVALSLSVGGGGDVGDGDGTKLEAKKWNYIGSM
jgi:hypothetical protein